MYYNNLRGLLKYNKVRSGKNMFSEAYSTFKHPSAFPLHYRHISASPLPLPRLIISRHTHTTCRPRPRGVPRRVARPRPSPSNRAAPGPSPSNTQVSPGPINTGHLKINVYRVAGGVLDRDGCRGYVRFVAHGSGRGWFWDAVNSTGGEMPVTFLDDALCCLHYHLPPKKKKAWNT